MKNIIKVLAVKPTYTAINVTTQTNKSFDLAINPSTLEMKVRVHDKWRDYANDELLSEIKLVLGLSPVSVSQVLLSISRARNLDAIKSVGKLIQHLPESQRHVCHLAAQRRSLELQGLVETTA
jgi:hypothetical protein